MDNQKGEVTENPKESDGGVRLLGFSSDAPGAPTPEKDEPADQVPDDDNLDKEFRFICENQEDFPFIDSNIEFQRQGEVNIGELIVHILFGIAFNYYICVCMALIIINLKKYIRG